MCKFLISIVALSTMISGCASLSENQCRAGNWEQIGYRDGAQGWRGERIESHREACAEYAITPDERAYERGRERGLASFCTVSNGYRVGANGSDYAGVCPQDSEGAFLRGYDFGLHVHDVAVRMQDVQAQIQSVHERLEHRDDLDERERDRLFYQLGALEREYDQLQEDYRHMQWDAQRLR